MVVAHSSTHVVHLVDTILFEIVFKCDLLHRYVCKFHMNSILGACGTQTWVGLTTSNTNVVQQLDTILFGVVLESKSMRFGVLLAGTTNKLCVICCCDLLVWYTLSELCVRDLECS